jgi:hypothetical protein
MQSTDELHKRPFPRSYWVIPGGLLAGYYPGDCNMAEMDRKLSSLIESGIRTFINLMEPDEVDHDGIRFTPYDRRVKALARHQDLKVFTYRHEVIDLCIPSLPDMKNILNRIDESMARGCPVYVHCWGGRGRTGVVVGCWLVRHGLAEDSGAIRMIAHLRRNEEKASLSSPQTEKQIRMVLNWRKGE